MHNNEYIQLLWSYRLQKSLNQEVPAILIHMEITKACLHLQNIMNEIYNIRLSGKFVQLIYC